MKTSVNLEEWYKIWTYEYLGEKIDNYKHKLLTHYLCIADLLDIWGWKISDEIIKKSLLIWNLAIKSNTINRLIYFLRVNNIWYEVFLECNPIDITIFDPKLLKRILTWDVLIAFMDNYTKMILLNKQYTVSEEVGKILWN